MSSKYIRNEEGRTCTKCETFLSWDNFPISHRNAQDRKIWQVRACVCRPCDNLRKRRTYGDTIHRISYDSIISRPEKERPPAPPQYWEISEKDNLQKTNWDWFNK